MADSHLARLLGTASQRLSYRRLLVLALATGLLTAGYITSDHWTLLAAVFVGGEAFEKAAGAMRRGTA